MPRRISSMDARPSHTAARPVSKGTNAAQEHFRNSPLDTRQTSAGDFVGISTNGKRKRTITADEIFDPTSTSVVDVETLSTPWIDGLPMTEYESMEQRLHDEIVAYTSFILPTPQERTARQQVICFIEKIIKGRFRNIEVHVFGSVAQDLCLPDGDIDLVLSYPEARDVKKILFQISSLIKGSRLANNPQVIHWAKIPVLKFQTTRDFGLFNIDISVNITDGTSAIAPINTYLSTFPALRPLVLVIKGFLSQRKLNSAASSSLSSYVLICMTISFLQLNPGERPKTFMDKYMESESLGTLLMDFFLYYGKTFPYETDYITEGKLRAKTDADWIKNEPRDRLAVQCLVRPDNDIGKPVGRIRVIREAFCDIWKTLSESPLVSNNLRAVVSLPRSTLEHRELVRTIVDSGSLAVKLAAPIRSGPNRRDRVQTGWRSRPSERDVHNFNGPNRRDRIQTGWRSRPSERDVRT